MHLGTLELNSVKPLELAFPGYRFDGQIQDDCPAGPDILGLQTIRCGLLSVEVGFAGTGIMVKCCLDAVGEVAAASFKTLLLSFGHVFEHDEISYGVEGDKETACLEVQLQPAEQILWVRLSGDVSAEHFKPVEFQFTYSCFRFPNMQPLAQLHRMTPVQMQNIMDTGRWTAVHTNRKIQRDVKIRTQLVEVFKLLGGGTFIEDSLAYLSSGCVRVSTAWVCARDWLVAIGVADRTTAAMGYGLGSGFYFTEQDLGVFGTASASLGCTLTQGQELQLAIYWGIGGAGTALENFNSVKNVVYANQGLHYGSCSFSFDQGGRPVGCTIALDSVGGVADAVGASALATRNFAVP